MIQAQNCDDTAYAFAFIVLIIQYVSKFYNIFNSFLIKYHKSHKNDMFYNSKNGFFHPKQDKIKWYAAIFNPCLLRWKGRFRPSRSNCHSLPTRTTLDDAP